MLQRRCYQRRSGSALTAVSNTLITKRSASDQPVIVADTQRVPNFPTLNHLGQIVMTVQRDNRESFELRTLVVKATPRFLRGIE